MIIRTSKNNRMSRTVEHENVIYTAGLVPTDLSLDIKGQTADVLALSEKVFAEAGTNKENLLKCEIFLSSITLFDEFNVVWDEWVSNENPPVRACVEARMADPRILVEVVFTAAKA